MTDINAEAVTIDGCRVDLEQSAASWGASSPDAPGCFAVGGTREEALRLMQEALTEHISLLQELGMTAPSAARLENKALENEVAA